MADDLAKPEANHIEHAWNTHSYLNNYVQFADAKAGVLLAFSTAAIITTLKSSAFGVAKTDLNTGHVAVVAFGGCFFCCVLVVAPRLFTWKTMGKTFSLFRKCNVESSEESDDDRALRSTIFWQGILNHEKPANFYSALLGLDQPHLLREVAFHNFELSAVLVQKYRWLKFAFWLFAFASFFMAVFFLCHGFNISEPSK